jgi:hypothetical protein
MDPYVAALASVVSALALALYRALLLRCERAEKAEQFWMMRALASTGLAELALDHVEKEAR